jgi:hypothetical protein
MIELIDPKSDYDYGFMVGQRANRRGTPVLRQYSTWFWRGYLDSAGSIAWPTQPSTGIFWPCLSVRGSVAIQTAFQSFVTPWVTEHTQERVYARLRRANAHWEREEGIKGKAAVAVIRVLYALLPEEPWFRTPDRLSREIPKILTWSPRDRKPVKPPTKWHFDAFICAQILENQGIFELVRDTYRKADTPELIYEAGYRTGGGPVKGARSPERGELRAYPEFCEPIAEAQKNNAIFWRGWFDRGAGFVANSPFGVISLPMTLGCAMALWEFFGDPQMYDEHAASGFTVRTLWKPFVVVRRLYLEPSFDPAVCQATPGHRQGLINYAREIIEQVKE